MHSVIQLRGNYGPIGWNTAYHFQENDFKCSLRHIVDTTLNKTEIDFTELQYILAEVHYGGRVTDENDRLCIRVITESFINHSLFQEETKIHANSSE